MQASSRVALNTAISSARMVITAVLSLYTTRLILNGLGASDFGIYNLVAGVIMMVSFINISMSFATQRFFSFHDGRRSMRMKRRVFAGSVVLHAAIGVILVVVLVALTPLLFNGLLNIPAERVAAAKAIYLFTAVTLFFSVMSVPFTALLIARENMLWVTAVNIAETVLRLVIAAMLFVVGVDKLLYFGCAMAGISIISLVMSGWYCMARYDECKVSLRKNFDRGLVREMASMAGWNTIGVGTFFACSQGLSIILNLFMGTVINAAYGIASQVSGQMSFFATTLSRTLNPQIVKSEGMKNRERMLRLSMIGCKFGFFLVAVIAIPCLFELGPLLRLWLKSPPDHAVAICGLLVICEMVSQLTKGFDSATMAVGKIKLYQVSVSVIRLMVLPCAWFVMRAGLDVAWVFAGYIAVEIVVISVKLSLLRSLVELDVEQYFRRVLFRCLLPVATTCAAMAAMVFTMEFPLRFLVTLPAGAVLFAAACYFTGLCGDEKQMINSMAANAKNKIFKH